MWPSICAVRRRPSAAGRASSLAAKISACCGFLRAVPTVSWCFRKRPIFFTRLPRTTHPKTNDASCGTTRKSASAGRSMARRCCPPKTSWEHHCGPPRSTPERREHDERTSWVIATSCALPLFDVRRAHLLEVGDAGEDFLDPIHLRRTHAFVERAGEQVADPRAPESAA